MNSHEQIGQLIDPQIWTEKVAVYKGDLGRQMRGEFGRVGERNWEAEAGIARGFYDTYLASYATNFHGGKAEFVDNLGHYVEAILSLEDYYHKGHFAKTSSPIEKRRGTRQQRQKRDTHETPPKNLAALNAIIAETIERFAIDVADAVGSEENELLTQVSTAMSVNGHMDSSLVHASMLLDSLQTRIESLQKVYDWINRLKKNDALQRVLSVTDRNDIIAAKQDLEQRLHLETEKTVPMGIFDSPLFLDQDHVFSTYDKYLNVVDEQLIHFRGYAPPTPVTFAHIAYAKQPTANTITRPVVEEVDKGTTVFTGVYLPEEVEAVFRLGTNGTWYISPFGQVPLENIFEKKNAVDEGRVLEIFLLMRLFDLTGRPEIISQMPSITDFESELMRAQTKKPSFLRRFGFRRRVGDASLDFNFIRHLVTPRLIDHLPRSLENSGELSVDIVSDKNIPDEGNIIYEKRKVPVSATLKRLPPGYNASKRAKDIAQNFFGIEELPTGWTIVSGHMGERIVRVNRDTGDMLVRKFIFRGADEDVINRLQDMVLRIQQGKDPRARKLD